MVGTIASIAPTLGPVIGGWITDTLNWHWLFYVNLVPGLVITALVPLLVKIDKPDLSLLRDADYPGIVLMAVGLGTLEYVLEEGTRWNWFSDGDIRTCAWIAGIALVAVHRPQPDLSKSGGRSARAGQPQFRAGLPAVVHHRHGHFHHDLPDAAVPGLCARLQRVADRHRDLLHRRRLAARHAGLHHACAQLSTCAG